MHCETLSAFVSALIMTTEISLLSGSLLMTLRTSSPFKSGIIRSRRMRLNFSFSISAIASFPPAAGDPLVAIGFEHQLQRVAIILIVIDDEDTGEVRCHEPL